MAKRTSTTPQAASKPAPKPRRARPAIPSTVRVAPQAAQLVAQQIALPLTETDPQLPVVRERLAPVTVLPTPRPTPRDPTRNAPSDEARPAPRTRETKASVRQCFGELRDAIDEGWEIVQPIYARPLWSVSDDSTTAFSFVLRRERATRLVTVPEGRTVERFIRDRQLTVDYRR